MVADIPFYEDRGIGSPSVLYEQDTFRMFYAMGGADFKGRIGYAYSTDGINWTKAGAVVEPDSNSSWASFFLDTPEIIKDSSGYKLYFFGDDNNDPVGGSFGVMTSTDLINWTPADSLPILTPGNPGDWDGLFIESPTVTFANGTYYMLYSGIDTTWRVRIGLATSQDGIHWTKFAGNPILDVGSFNSWEGFAVATPTLINNNNNFEAWYCGTSIQDWLDNNNIDTIKVGYATSTDGFNWQKYNNNPVLSTYFPSFTPKELRGPWAPDVVFLQDSSKYYMFYETAYGFGLATSDIVTNVKTNSSIKTYFNYLENYLFVKSDNGLLGIEIYSINGELILEYKFNTGKNTFKLELSNLQAGMYIAGITDNKGNVKFFKFIKQK